MAVRPRIAALLLAPLLAACRGADGGGGAAGGAPRAAERAVVAELERYYADFSARDWDRFAAHFADDARLASVWQPPGEDAPRIVLTSIPEFVARAPEGPGSAPVFEEWMEDVDVRIEGELATAWARFGARFGHPDELAEWSGVDAFTLLRDEAGRWRIVSLAYAATH